MEDKEDGGASPSSVYLPLQAAGCCSWSCNGMLGLGLVLSKEEIILAHNDRPTKSGTQQSFHSNQYKATKSQ